MRPELNQTSHLNLRLDPRRTSWLAEYQEDLCYACLPVTLLLSVSLPDSRAGYPVSFDSEHPRLHCKVNQKSHRIFKNIQGWRCHSAGPSRGSLQGIFRLATRPCPHNSIIPAPRRRSPQLLQLSKPLIAQGEWAEYRYGRRPPYLYFSTHDGLPRKFF